MFFPHLALYTLNIIGYSHNLQFFIIHNRVTCPRVAVPWLADASCIYYIPAACLYQSLLFIHHKITRWCFHNDKGLMAVAEETEPVVKMLETELCITHRKEIMPRFRFLRCCMNEQYVLILVFLPERERPEYVFRLFCHHPGSPFDRGPRIFIKIGNVCQANDPPIVIAGKKRLA